MPSYDVGRERKNRIRPYFAVIRQSRAHKSGKPTGRWFWTVRRHADNSTAFRGSGNGFPSQEAALDDLRRVTSTLTRMTLGVRES